MFSGTFLVLGNNQPLSTWLKLDTKWAGDGDMYVLGVEALHGVTITVWFPKGQGLKII